MKIYRYVFLENKIECHLDLQMNGMKDQNETVSHIDFY